MNKKVILIFALVFILSIGAGLGTMALYQKQMSTSSQGIRTATFNPVVTGKGSSDADSKLWEGRRIFKNIDNLKPEMTTFIGEFTINTEDIQVDNKVLINGSVNSEFEGSNVKIEIEGIEGSDQRFEFDKNSNEWKDIKPGRYKVEIEWPEPYIDQNYVYKKNPDGSFIKLEGNELENYSKELYTKDATYAGKTGSIDLKVKVVQK